jgi:hypothetical protein
MHIWEILGEKSKPSTAGVHSKASKHDRRTEFEKNASKLRSKERKLKPQLPVKPVKHKG